MVPAWLAATGVTAVVVWAAHRHALRRRCEAGNDPIPRPGRVGVVLVVLAAVLVVVLRDPALPILALGTVAAAFALARRRLVTADLLAAANPTVLLGLLGLAVGLGTLARAWTGPRTLLKSADRWETAGIAVAAAISVNNLPAAVLLSSTPPAHARALLLGLNIGPNLVLTGSLSAILWLQVARREGFRPSLARYSRVGVVVVPLAIVAALAAST